MWEEVRRKGAGNTEAKVEAIQNHQDRILVAKLQQH